MKVTVTIENDHEDDGFSGSTAVTRNGLETEYDLMYCFAEVARIAGFSVERVGWSDKRGATKWSDF
jgi:hypothetical protein